MRMTFGPIHVTLKYAYRRTPKDPGSNIIYQRPVPTDLRDRYRGKTIKLDLKHPDMVKAARQVADLNKRYEAEFAGLRAAPESSPQALKVHAAALLKTYGLTPSEIAPFGDVETPGADQFFDRLRDKLELYAGNDRDVHDNATPVDYLSPVENAALKALQGNRSTTLTDALDLHLSIHPQRDNLKFTTYQRRAFATLIAITGDKNMEGFKRTDARAYLDASLLTAKTATVRRRLGVMSAVFATYIREHDLTISNPFASLAIDREGHDSTKRTPFTLPELETLEAACRDQDDPMRWILEMLAGTGARLAEIVGLTMEDINLEEEYPHVILQVHPWRDIKGAKGIRGVKDRTVPLVGVALWAAQQVKNHAINGQRFAFPQYTTATLCKASHASGALNSWLKRVPLAHTCHELRHTVKDQLRSVQCPKEISDAITGHGTKSVGDSYGLGYDLHVKSEWLSRALNRNPAL